MNLLRLSDSYINTDRIDLFHFTASQAWSVTMSGKTFLIAKPFDIEIFNKWIKDQTPKSVLPPAPVAIMEKPPISPSKPKDHYKKGK